MSFNSTLKLKIPFLAGIYGRQGTGKSFLMRHILLDEPNRLIDQFKPNNIIMYVKNPGSKGNPLRDVVKELQNKGAATQNIYQDAQAFELRVVQIMDKQQQIINNHTDDDDPDPEDYLIVADDGKNTLSIHEKGSLYDDLATDSRHQRITMLNALQYYKSISPDYRNACSYNFYFNMITNELNKICQEICPLSGIKMVDFRKIVMGDAVQNSGADHGFLTYIPGADHPYLYKLEGYYDY